MDSIHITSALISVYDKTGLDILVKELDSQHVTIYSTGGTYNFITQLGINTIKVEDLTGYPSMLDGRVKTLHPAVFGGILARRDEDHLGQLTKYNLPRIDLVAVDLYPFEKTLETTDDDNQIIEKIDIGGVSLLRAAAKNHQSVVVISKRDQYHKVARWLHENNGSTTIAQRTLLAYESFQVTAHYDTVIGNYFAEKSGNIHSLRYGENPQQRALFIGDTRPIFKQLSGKELSYNNLVDVDAAINIISEFKNNEPTFVIIKHTNPCGVATRPTVMEAWKAALACDPTSAFGGIIISNSGLDIETAKEIDQLFYEVVLAPEYGEGVVELLAMKKNRIIIQLYSMKMPEIQQKTLLGGTIQQGTDHLPIEEENFNQVTKSTIPSDRKEDLIFGIKCVRHLKSNAIAIVKNRQMIGSGVGQTSRVDALNQAIDKAKRMGFDLKGSVLASDAFFPFADSVELAHKSGIQYIIQPGGSVRDADSIKYCDDNEMAMYFTGVRHFKH